MKTEELCINTIRTLAIDMIQKANSGHPGMPLGAAPTAYVLWTKFMRFIPAIPLWADRYRFLRQPALESRPAIHHEQHLLPPYLALAMTNDQ